MAEGEGSSGEEWMDEDASVISVHQAGRRTDPPALPVEAADARAPGEEVESPASSLENASSKALVSSPSSAGELPAFDDTASAMEQPQLDPSPLKPTKSSHHTIPGASDSLGVSTNRSRARRGLR
jgi:hypothetical protein